MLTLPALQNIMKFQQFFKNHQISSNLQNILESSSETCMWNLSLFREVKFFHRKRLTVTALEIWNFTIFFKIHLISSNMQNILESSSETFKWNSSPFREVKLYQRKMPTVPALEILSNFKFFSKFTKFHQTFRTYWNHHQKHACEISVNSEKLTYFIEKSPQCRPYKYHDISTFIQNSPNFIKLAEHIGIIIRNMHVKFEPIQRSQLISKKNTDSASPLKYHEISTFFQSSPTFFKLAEHIGIIIRNMHVKFEPIQRSKIFS